MEAVLKFKLPEDQEDFDNACKGSKYYNFMWDLSQILRDKLKHGHTYESADAVLEDLREIVCTAGNEVGVEL